jgi:putative DNA primase/helicase
MNEMYNAIAREFMSAPMNLDSDTLRDIFTHLEAGTVETAMMLVPKLGEVEFERNRKRIAELANVRPAMLDKMRKQAVKAENSSKSLQGRELKLPEITPAAEPQNGAKLLDDIAKQIRRFIVADDVSIDAITLWIVFSHIATKAPVCPNLVFSSAVKACGKSTALNVVSRLVPKPLSVSNISVAALFRVVEMLAPSLLIDEADAMFRNNDDLRTLVNAGFTKTAATVVRIVGDELAPRLFNVYSPKVVALIGSLPDTIESRSVVVRMRRRLLDEPLEQLRADRDQGFEPLAARIARYALDNGDAIIAEEPEIDQSLSDRQADVWRELLRIADHVGGEWPNRARIAAVELCARQSDENDLSIKLLGDIQRIFAESPDRTRWPSQALVDELVALDESPWGEINHGKPITTNRLARMLARFDLKTTTLRDGTHTPKGYTVSSFIDIFSRYLHSNRNTATNCDNSMQDNDIKCCGFVSVADGNRNISPDTVTTMSNQPQDALAQAENSKTVRLGAPLADWPAVKGLPEEDAELDIF